MCGSRYLKAYKHSALLTVWYNSAQTAHTGPFIKHVITLPQCGALLRRYFLFPVGKHLAQTTFTRSNKTCLLPLSAIPSPIVLHNISMHLTLNKLFRKASCRLQTVCTKQHEIIRCFNV